MTEPGGSLDLSDAQNHKETLDQEKNITPSYVLVLWTLSLPTTLTAYSNMKLTCLNTYEALQSQQAGLLLKNSG